MENAHSPRKSLYVKDFKAVDMGVMELKKAKANCCCAR